MKKNFLSLVLLYLFCPFSFAGPDAPIPHILLETCAEEKKCETEALIPLSKIQGAENEKKENSEFFLTPDYLVTQHGGYIGFYTIGIGWGKPNNWGQLSLQYGYIPESAAGIEIQQVSLKGEIHPFDEIAVPNIFITRKDPGIKFDPFYIGLSIIYSDHDDLFVEVPDQYPSDNYYGPTAIRYAGYIGASIRSGKGVLFFEASALETELGAFYRDRKHVDPNRDLKSFGAAAIGYKYFFKGN